MNKCVSIRTVPIVTFGIIDLKVKYAQSSKKTK